MASELMVEDLRDLMTATQEHQKKKTFTDLSYELQRFVVMREMLKKSNSRFQDGDYYKFEALMNDSGSARLTAPYAVDAVNSVDGLVSASVGWKFADTNWQIDNREIKVNSGMATQILNIWNVKEHQAMVSLAKMLERLFWGKPVNAADVMVPYGVFYWIVQNAASTGGFEGGNPAGFPGGAAGLDSDLYPNWKNWTDTYSKFTFEDMVSAMRKAAYKTGFTAPISWPGNVDASRLGWYCNFDTLMNMENILRAQNDNLGSDLAKMDGRTVFHGVPVESVPYLDGNVDATNPIIAIDWATFHPAFLSGQHFRRSKPQVAPQSHNVVVTWVDLGFNFVCEDRRKQSMIVYTS